MILAGHAYAGAVIASANDERVKALVYIAALAPDEGETVAQVFYAMKNTRNRLNSLRMVTVSSGCRMKASETLFHSMRPQNKSHYRRLSSGRFR